MEDLKRENAELRDAISRMRVEKNRLEDQLYRAFRRCLNSKKRKIRELQEQVEALRVDGDDVGSKKTKKTRKAVQRRINSSEEEASASSSGDETDVDSQVIYGNRRFTDEKEGSRKTTSAETPKQNDPIELDISDNMTTPRKNQEEQQQDSDDMCIDEEIKGNKGSEKVSGKNQQASSGDETDFENEVDLEDLTKDF